MMDKQEDPGMEEGGADDVLLKKLLHLKGYEEPDESRMIKNRQNIMRRVRQTERKDWSLEHLLEMHIPWFFAEPRYGIALLFVVFAGLQFLGGRKTDNSGGVYASAPAANEPQESAMYAEASTNNMVYPELPDQIKFFPSPADRGQAVFVKQQLNGE